MTFNQFWHSLCLSGILPVHYMNYSMVSATAGPAKLIQTFYPSKKNEDNLNKALHSLTTSFSKFGFNGMTEFFIENMLCEIWRAGCRTNRSLKRGMTDSVRAKYLLSDEFFNCFQALGPTKNPDLYYRDPFTHNYQHLFRMNGKVLQMRPSTAKQDGRNSKFVKCFIECGPTKDSKISVKWSGDLLRLGKQEPAAWFIPQ